MATIGKYETSSGTTLYRVRYRTPENKQTDKRGFTTKRDAERFAATVEVAKMRGEYVAPTLGRVTVGELGPAWLTRQRGHLKPSGFRSYEGVWRLHVEPRWGHARVSDIRFSEVQAWVSELASRRSPVVVQMSHSVLARILGDAVKDRLVAANPARGVKLPPVVRKQNVYLTAAQLHALAPRPGGITRWRCCWAPPVCAGVRWPRCGCAMSIFCAVASTCIATR